MHYRVRYLQYILTVAETRSFTRAAIILGISQPALSSRIQAEEERIGFRLFDRSGKRIVVTEKGQALMPGIREVVQSAIRLEKLMADLGSATDGPVLVGVSLASDLPERGRLFAGFAAEFTTIPIEQQAGNVPVVMQRVLEGTLDAAIVVGPPDDRFECLVLKWLENEVFVPSELQVASQSDLDADSLSGLTLAAFRRERHPAQYDLTVCPLVDAGVKVVLAPDDSAGGLLAFASAKRAILLSSHVRCSDEQLARADMVRRPLRLEPVTALMSIRAKGGCSPAGNRFWQFAQRFASAGHRVS